MFGYVSSPVPQQKNLKTKPLVLIVLQLDQREKSGSQVHFLLVYFNLLWSLQPAAVAIKANAVS